jgi:hypothetical protein
LDLAYFSSQYPDQVKGLLLLDPTAEAYYEHLSEGERKAYLDFVKKIEFKKTEISKRRGSNFKQFSLYERSQNPSRLANNIDFSYCYAKEILFSHPS